MRVRARHLVAPHWATPEGLRRSGLRFWNRRLWIRDGDLRPHESLIRRSRALWLTSPGPILGQEIIRDARRLQGLYVEAETQVDGALLESLRLREFSGTFEQLAHVETAHLDLLWLVGDQIPAGLDLPKRLRNLRVTVRTGAVSLETLRGDPPLDALEINAPGTLDLRSLSRFQSLTNLNIQGPRKVHGFVEIADLPILFSLQVRRVASVDAPQSIALSSARHILVTPNRFVEDGTAQRLADERDSVSIDKMWMPTKR